MQTAAMTHAAERPEVPATMQHGAGFTAQGHSQNDGDQVPADSDNGLPHHHGGCHGDHLAAPVKLAAVSPHFEVRAALSPADRIVRPRSTADPALRPPRA